MRTRRLVVAAAIGGLLGGCQLFGGSDAPEDAPEEGSAAAAGPETSDAPESEPNDTPEQAPRLTPGRAISGAFEGPTDVDMYRLPPHDEILELVVESTANARVDVFGERDGAGYVVDVPADRPTRIGPFPSATGLRISLTGEGSWRLLAQPAAEPELACGLALEPDRPGAPGAVLRALPSQVTGCIAAAGDEDTFVIEANAFAAGDPFGVFVSGVEGISFDVRVSDALGQPLAELIGGPGETVGVPAIAPQTGAVTVTVRSLAGANDQTPYRLEVRRVPPLNGVVEAEPDNDAESAFEVAAIDLINGYLHTPGDIDYYRLQTEDTRVVRLVAESPDGVDLQLFLDDGTMFGPATIDDGRVGDPESICSLRVGPEAAFLFGVRAREARQEVLQPYLVHFEFYEGTDFEVEPNDTLAELVVEPVPEATRPPVIGIWTTAEAASLSASGHLFPPGDVDLFAIEVFGDEYVDATYQSVTVRLEPNGPSDYVLELLDADGAVVARSSAGVRGEQERVALDLPSGDYFARVTMTAGEPCAEPYRLVVEQTAIPIGAGGPDPMNPTVEQRIIVTTVAEGSGSGPAAEGSGAGGAEPVLPERIRRDRRDRVRPPRPPVVQPGTNTAPSTPPSGTNQAPPSRQPSEFWPGRQ